MQSRVNILTEVARHLEALTTVRDFSQKTDLKRRTFRQGDYLIVGTR